LHILAKTSDNFWQNKDDEASPKPKTKFGYGVWNKELNIIGSESK